ncbi:MAG: hypothetical protein WBW55_13755 [Desulfobaccales bacterium]
MAGAKKARSRLGRTLAPLPPAAAAALQSQIEALVAACRQGAELESLKGLVSASPEELLWDLHLMANLANIPNPLIPLLLAEMFGSSPDSSRRKALKRALHLLKTRGVLVPREALPREEPVIREEQPPATQTRVSPIMGNGDSVVVLEAPKEILGGNFLVAFLSDASGFQECQLLSLNNKQQKEFWDHYREQGLAEWFPVPGPYAVRLLEEAYAQPRRDAAAAGSYPNLRERIWKYWGRPDAAPDLEQTLTDLDPAERSRLLPQSRQLAEEPIFHYWLPGYQEIEPWFHKLQEILESPLVLSDHQKQGRTDALVEEAALALYPLESRGRLRHRLLATAYYLELSQRPEKARIAGAAAAALGDPQGGILARENPFLTGLVSAALMLALEDFRKTREAPAPGGLLTLPGKSGLIRR